MTALTPRQELRKPLAGLVFVVFWVVAIVLWVIASGIADPNTGAFVVDTGIVFFSVGFAALFLQSKRGLWLSFLWGAIGVLFFALGDFGQITPLVYFLRILVPFVALLAPVFRLANSVKVFPTA
jgi:hypothetical protein